MDQFPVLAPDSSFLPVWLLGVNYDGSSHWVPATCVVILDCVPGSGFSLAQPQDMWKINQWTGSLYLSLSAF